MLEYRYSRWDGTQSINPFTAEELMDAMSDDLIANGDLRQALQRLMRQIDQGQMGDRMQGLRQLLEQLKRRRQQELQRNDLSSVVDDIKRRLEEIVQQERGGIDQRLQEQRQPGDSHPGERSDIGNQQANPSQQDGDQQPESRPRPGSPSYQQSGQPMPSGQQAGSQGGDDQSASDPSLQQMLENVARRKQQYLDALPDDPAGQIKALQQYEFMDAQAREKFEELLNMLRQQMMQQFSQ